MKPVHEKLPKDHFQPGITYRVAMQDTELYEADVVKYHGGCWATVRVVRPLNDTYAADYRPGTEFDIKVAQYTFTETENAGAGTGVV